MRLTAALYSAPKFHFWKDFGAGKMKKRYPHHKYWHHHWKKTILNPVIRDERLASHELPEGSRVVKAEDLVHIEIPEAKKIQFYNHPWPFNVAEDPINTRPKVYNYKWSTRLYKPMEDGLAFTNTIMESSLEVPDNPKLDLTDKELETLNTRYNWAAKDDFTLFKLPRKRQFPRIDQRPKTKFGIPKDRAGVNVITTLDDFFGTSLAQRFHTYKANNDLEQLIDRRNISYPNSIVPLERDGSRLNLHLSNDLVSLTNSRMPLVNKVPEKTLEKPRISIHPRSWRSLIERTSSYNDNYQFKLPVESHVHTIMLTTKSPRTLNENEMFATSLIHSYGMAIQMARLHESGSPFLGDSALKDLLSNEVNNKEKLDRGVCIQAIGYEVEIGAFHFLRFQLNSTDYQSEVKNQVWYSGRVDNIEEVSRYWLDFQSYGVREERLASVSSISG